MKDEPNRRDHDSGRLHRWIQTGLAVAKFLIWLIVWIVFDVWRR